MRIQEINVQPIAIIYQYTKIQCFFVLSLTSDIFIIIIIIKKKVDSARLRESDIHPISPRTPAPQYQPIDRKKRKGKRVEDYSRDREA